MEELSADVCEVADEVDQQRFGESGVMSKTRGRWAAKTAEQTNECRAEQYHDEWYDAFDDVQSHDVVQTDHAELLKHPV